MGNGTNKGTIIAAVIGAVAVVVAALISSRNAPSSGTGPAAPAPRVTAGMASPSPTPQQFSFGVTVRDRDSNTPVGQSAVGISVGNEPVARAVTDDNGQANFVLDAAYAGKRARLYAESPRHRPADLEVALTTERKIIQLIPQE